MKHQYAGDINDYRKYALLRALSAGGRVKLGVCWMLTPPDGSSDGQKRAYLNQPDLYRHHDPELFDVLRSVAAADDAARLGAIEASGVIPGALYFNDTLRDQHTERQSYFTSCRTALADANLIFFDPDNGLDVPSVRKGTRNSSKFVYLDEIAAFYRAGKSALIYQHFPRVQRDLFIASCGERLRSIASDAQIWAYHTKHVVFLALLNPELNYLTESAADYASSAWNDDFISGRKLSL